MIRLGVAGILVATALAGCQELSTPSTSSAQQALEVCDGKMPGLEAWNGKPIQPLTPSSVLVVFPYQQQQKGGSTAMWMIADYEADSGKVLSAVTVADNDSEFGSLSENLVRLSQQVRIPGIPPDPCGNEWYKCYPFISAVAIHTTWALEDARKEYESCF